MEECDFSKWAAFDAWRGATLQYIGTKLELNQVLLQWVECERGLTSAGPAGIMTHVCVTLRWRNIELLIVKKKNPSSGLVSGGSYANAGVNHDGKKRYQWRRVSYTDPDGVIHLVNLQPAVSNTDGGALAVRPQCLLLRNCWQAPHYSDAAPWFPWQKWCQRSVSASTPAVVVQKNDLRSSCRIYSPTRHNNTSDC